MGEGMKRQIIKHLPEELTTEILSNWPVKSLLRFQSVSKPWRSLISSAKFVKYHLNRSNSDPDLAHHSLIGNFYDKETGLSVSSCSLKSLLVEPNQDDVVPTWDHTGLYSISILGSCNGLILYTERLLHGYWFHLWNPSTRQLKTISPPSSRPQEYAHLPYHYYVYGFGYDDLTDDYKVVWVMSSYRGGREEIHRTEIYTVRTDSWKKIGNFEKSFHSLDCLGKFVNGKLHWLVREEEEDVWTIVSLGLVEGEEKYQVVAMPSNYDPCGPTLENLGGYLSLIGSLVGANGMEDINIWVMMKYGVAESWTKIWTLSDFHDRRPICAGVKPFWVTKNGDIFVGFDKSKVVVYNAKNKLREYGINKDELQPPPENSTTSEDDHFYECSASLNEPLLVYVESLVSP